MTIREALHWGKLQLQEMDDNDTPSLDAALLLAHVLQISRERLYMELSSSLSRQKQEEYTVILNQRATGEPVAWILGTKEFWGRDYRVGPGVLCPRPDSEVLIEAVSASMQEWQQGGRLHDCCCGPGTLGLALAADHPHWKVSASDISPHAQKYFLINSQRLTQNQVPYVHSNLMNAVEGPFEIIISNPPYLTPLETEERKNRGWQEPSLALDGGDHDGLALIRRLIPQCASRLVKGGKLFLEADPLQMPLISRILSNNGFADIRIIPDLGGRDRVAAAVWKGAT
ncbi:MAG: peptide chain release factor N(5)-glutamine methyltransferase [Spirochaetales bacterium]|nr:peptide chain release factor N(5)-glutamine methyltransferase [Spirochaetales bacterium]